MVINGVEVAEPENFSPVPTLVKRNEMENGLGEDLYDIVRTKDALNLEWSFLPPHVLAALQEKTNPLTYLDYMVTYPTPEGEKSARFRTTKPITAISLGLDRLYGYVWGDVKMEIQEV